MTVSINQPAYLPWLGYFNRIAVSDLHVVLDHVQLEKSGFTKRNKIRMKEGWCWLTVPVETKGRFGDLAIDELKISNDTRWAEKHLNALRRNYARAPHFVEHEAFFAKVYSQSWDSLAVLMREITGYLLNAFQISTPLRYSSEMNPTGKKDELILNLCRATGAKTYLSGPLGRNYLREQLFREAGIQVVYHDYRHPQYRQVYPGFEPYMAAVDLLFNYGPQSREILMQQGPLTK